MYLASVLTEEIKLVSYIAASSLLLAISEISSKTEFKETEIAYIVYLAFENSCLSFEQFLDLFFSNEL